MTQQGFIGSLWATLGVDTAGMEEAGVAMRKFEAVSTDSLARISQRFRTFGYLASAVITLPIAMAGKAVIKTAEDFQYSMQKIVGLVGISQDQVDKWSKALMEMGPRVSKSPEELAEALYFVTSGGYKTSQALGIVEISAKAAAAGLGETKDVADFVTSAMNAYKASNLSASTATSFQ